jgi:hypothetical protein
MLIPDSGPAGWCWLLPLLAASICSRLLVATTAGWCWLLVAGGFCWLPLPSAADVWLVAAAGRTLMLVAAGWLLLLGGRWQLLAVDVGRLLSASGWWLEGEGGTPLRYM